MTTTMARKLEELLTSISQVEFDADWKKVVELGLEGPSAFDVLDYYAAFKQVHGNYNIKNNDITVPEFDYSLAA